MNLTEQRDLEHDKISQSAEYLWGHIEVNGTGGNSNDSSAGYFYYWKPGDKTRYSEVAANRGLTLCIWNHSDMSLYSGERFVFDVYGYDSERNKLAAQLDAIHKGEYGNVIYALASYDAINSNTTLANAMTTARAYHWFNQPGMSNGPNHRHPYAAIGTSRLGIIKEVLHSNASGADDAFVSLSVPKDWDAIGAEGYGPCILEGAEMIECNYDGTGYGFKHTYVTIPDSGWQHIKDDEYIRITGQQKISRDRQLAGGLVQSYVWTASDTDGWIASASRAGYSVEWEPFEYYFKWNKTRDTASGNNTGNAEAKYFRTGHYHMPSGTSTGTSSIRNVTYHKSGFNPNPTSEVAVREPVISAKEIHEGVGFHLGNPESYYDIWNSSRNLTNRPNLGDSRLGSGFDTEDVRWFNRTLTARNEYSIHEGKNYSGDSNRYGQIGYTTIDPSKMYVGLIWMNCLQKEDGGGRNYLGTHTLNAAGSLVPTYAYAGTSNTTNPYSQYPQGQHIEKDKWSLMSYWFLPHNWTDAEGTAFYNDYWCRVWGNYENGSADNLSKTLGSVSSNGGNIRVSRFQSTDAQIHLRWLDYYNTSTQGDGGHHKTWWALPGIFEVDPMQLQTDGELFSWNLKEI